MRNPCPTPYNPHTMTTPTQTPPPEIDDLSRTIGALQEGQRQHDHRFDHIDQELRDVRKRQDQIFYAIIIAGTAILGVGIAIALRI